MAPKVVVVGAGVIGAAVAYHLANRGARVHCVDRADRPAAGTTEVGFATATAYRRFPKSYFELNQAGIAAGVSCSPVIPGITDTPRNLEAVVRATARAGGKHVFANPLFLKPCSAAVFLPFLEKEFPQLVAGYHERYKDRAFLPASYGKRISQLMTRLRKKYGIVRGGERYGPRQPVTAQAGTQLPLF